MSLQRIPHDATKYRNNPVELLNISNRNRIGSVPDYAVTANTKLLITGTGENNSTTILDSTGKTVTRYGDAKISTAQSIIGGSSIYFDGNEDYLTIGSPSDWTFLHDGSSWTVDMWVHHSNFHDSSCLFSSSNGASANAGLYCYTTSNGTIGIIINRAVFSSSVLSGTFGNIPTIGTFYHIEINFDYSLSSANAKCFINGVLLGSINKSGNAPSTSDPPVALWVGSISGYSTYYLNGYVSHIRVAQGITHTSNFTPPKYISNNYIGA